MLQGGSAIGFAHLGVLEWLEENRIPIDYLSGASMGSLVGGLYASGLDTVEIRQMLEQIDWDVMFRPIPDHRHLYFRRKEDRREFQNQIELGPKGFTSGLNSMHEVETFLAGATIGYSQPLKFDDLPIPYRTVVTDIGSEPPAPPEEPPLPYLVSPISISPRFRRTKGLKEGSLYQAMRSSMAIPIVFTPVNRDKTIYMDGGIFDNLPVSQFLAPSNVPVNKGWRPTCLITVRLQRGDRPCK